MNDNKDIKINKKYFNLYNSIRRTNNNFHDSDLKSEYIKAINKEFSLNKNKFSLKSLFNNSLNAYNKRNKSKKSFKDKILRLSIDNYPYKLYNLNNKFSLVIKKTLLDKFKYLPNINKYHNLTNKKLLELTEPNEDHSFILHKQKINNYFIKKYNNNYICHTCENKQISNDKDKSIIISEKNKGGNNNIRDNILKSECSNNKFRIRFSLLNKFDSRNSTNNNKKIFNKKYKLNTYNFINNKNINKELKANNDNYLYSKSFSVQKKRNKSSSTNRKLLYELINKNENSEDNISDGKPGDKYKFFKNQLEKKKKILFKQLIELRRNQK